MITRILLFLAVTLIALSEELPPLHKTIQGMQRFGDYEVIYGEDGHRFLFGVLIYRDPFTSLSKASSQQTTLQLQSGITLAFVTNEVTVARATKKVTTELKPFRIYLMNKDLSMASSANISDIELRPRRVWSRSAKDYLTVDDLVLPKDLLKRFGQ
jgi:hypothetical protein